MEQLKKAYQGKKVFLTGHTGFKGAWLLKILHLCGAQVLGYALAPEHADDLFHLIEGDSLCKSVIADLRDASRLKEEMVAFQPDFVFHLAAQPLVRLSYEIPAETFEVNALGTAFLLDAVRALENPCSVVVITTDKVYHNNEWVYPYRESDRLGGYDPYSASKACAEIIIDSYRNSFFPSGDFDRHKKGIAVARAGNVIGGGDWAKDRLLPDIARALGAGQPVVIRNPASVRPWQHVLEPLGGYLLLGTRLASEPLVFSQAYNFGPQADDALPVRQMADIALENWGSGTVETPSLTEQPHEAGMLKLDISKAKSDLSWTPSLSAFEAVKRTISWYKVYFSDKTQIVDFTSNQIMEFFGPVV